MSGTRLLDDLARALAEPMPRRRAIRLLGVSFVAATVPGVTARPASTGVMASPPCNPNVETCCGVDQRVCYKDAPVPKNKGYCCGPPSWKLWCGGKNNGYRCTNQCIETRNNFPCTATELDPEGAGINGQCCDRRVHVGCHTVAIPARRIKAGTCAVCPLSRPAICIPLKKGKGKCCKLDETCCATDVSSACCSPDIQTCVYPRRRNGSIDPNGQVTCRCKEGMGRACGPECCQPGETCTTSGCCPNARVCGPTGAKTCCSDGEFCFWRDPELSPLGGRQFGMCKRGCTPGNTAGTQCCGAGYRPNRQRTGCVT